jgi:hypothetical protein
MQRHVVSALVRPGAACRRQGPAASAALAVTGQSFEVLGGAP